MFEHALVPCLAQLEEGVGTGASKLENLVKSQFLAVCQQFFLRHGRQYTNEAENWHRSVY